jgi:hypothetical protein
MCKDIRPVLEIRKQTVHNTLDRGQVESGDLNPIPYFGAMTKIFWKRGPLHLIYFKGENI